MPNDANKDYLHDFIQAIIMEDEAQEKKEGFGYGPAQFISQGSQDHSSNMVM